MKTHTHRLLGTLLLASLGATWLGATALAQGTPPPATSAPTPPPPLTSDEADYLFGLSLGDTLHTIGVADSVHIEAIERGLKEGLKGQKFAPEDRRRLQEYVRASLQSQAEHNGKLAKEFLEKNAKEKGVKSTASGLEYKVLKAGDAKAAAPQPTDQVTVNYRGTLIDGTEFDSSYKRGEPAIFTLNGVIKGWQEGLALMKPGAKYQLFVPPELAYGPNPRPGNPGIPGNSLLIFEVELLSVKSNTPPKAEAAPMSKPTAGASTAPAAKPAAGGAPEPAARSITQP